MLTREKKVNLTKYIQTLKDRLASPIPKKHAGHPATFTLFLQRELTMAQAKLDADKLEGSGK